MKLGPVGAGKAEVVAARKQSLACGSCWSSAPLPPPMTTTVKMATNLPGEPLTVMPGHPAGHRTAGGAACFGLVTMMSCATTRKSTSQNRWSPE